MNNNRKLTKIMSALDENLINEAAEVLYKNQKKADSEAEHANSEPEFIPAEYTNKNKLNFLTVLTAAAATLVLISAVILTTTLGNNPDTALSGTSSYISSNCENESDSSENRPQKETGFEIVNNKYVDYADGTLRGSVWSLNSAVAYKTLRYYEDNLKDLNTKVTYNGSGYKQYYLLKAGDAFGESMTITEAGYSTQALVDENGQITDLDSAPVSNRLRAEGTASIRCYAYKDPSNSTEDTTKVALIVNAEQYANVIPYNLEFYTGGKEFSCTFDNGTLFSAASDLCIMYIYGNNTDWFVKEGLWEIELDFTAIEMLFSTADNYDEISLEVSNVEFVRKITQDGLETIYEIAQGIYVNRSDGTFENGMWSLNAAAIYYTEKYYHDNLSDTNSNNSSNNNYDYTLGLIKKGDAFGSGMTVTAARYSLSVSAENNEDIYNISKPMENYVRAEGSMKVKGYAYKEATGANQIVMIIDAEKYSELLPYNLCFNRGSDKLSYTFDDGTTFNAISGIDTIIMHNNTDWFTKEGLWEVELDVSAVDILYSENGAQDHFSFEISDATFIREITSDMIKSDTQ